MEVVEVNNNDVTPKEQSVRFTFQGKHDCNIHPCIASVYFCLSDDNQLRVVLEPDEQEQLEKHIIPLFSDLEPHNFIKFDELLNKDKNETNDDKNEEEEDDDYDEDYDNEEDEDDVEFVFVFKPYPNVAISIDLYQLFSEKDLESFMEQVSEDPKYYGKIVIDETNAKKDKELQLMYKSLKESLDKKEIKFIKDLLNHVESINLYLYNVDQCKWKPKNYNLPLFPERWFTENHGIENFSYSSLEEKVISEKYINLVLSFPLTKPVTFILQSKDGAFSMKELITQICSRYQKIYEKETDAFEENQLIEDSKEVDPLYQQLYKKGFELFSLMVKEQENLDETGRLLNYVHLSEETESQTSSNNDDEEGENVVFQTCGNPALFLFVNFEELKLDYLEYYPQTKTLVPRFDISKIDLSKYSTYVDFFDSVSDYDLEIV